MNQNEKKANKILNDSYIKEFKKALLKEAFIDSVRLGVAPSYELTEKGFKQWKSDRRNNGK